jgi:uncharacterized protein YndB with AHSA1/START domain
MTKLEISRTFAAPPERVWQAFTDPAALTDWFWPHLAAVVEVDLRIGGSYRITATKSPSDDFGISGEYVSVDPPRRLVFTWRWHGEPEETLVTIELASTGAEPGTTVMTLVHERFAGEASRDAHAQGWHDCLDRLPHWLSDSQLA